MLDKYIKIIDANIISGQDAKTKEWYCKELPCKDTDETCIKIAKLNKIYNEFNKNCKKEEKKK